VEATLDRVNARPDYLSHFNSAKPLHVAQEQHFSVDRVKLENGLFEHGRHLARGSLTFWGTQVYQCGSQLCLELVDRLQIGWLAYIPPAMLDAKAARNRVEPGAQRALPAEFAHRTRGREQCVLQHLAGVVLVSAHLHAKTTNSRGIALKSAR